MQDTCRLSATEQPVHYEGGIGQPHHGDRLHDNTFLGNKTLRLDYLHAA